MEFLGRIGVFIETRNCAKDYRSLNLSGNQRMKVGIRVDGGFEIGLGHIYKCIWLADTLRKKGHNIIFLTTEDPASTPLIRRNNFSTYLFTDAASETQKVLATNQWLREEKPEVLFVDHWLWPEDYWVSLEKPPGTLFAGADVPLVGLGRFDLAFQGPKNSLTNGEFCQQGCQVYEGPHFMMLSPEFLPYAGLWKPPLTLQNILLTFGGTDVANFSIKMLEGFAKIPHKYQLTLILGPGSANWVAVEGQIKNSSLSVKFLQDVPCVPAYMSRSDLVISTAGSGSLSELALTGAPAIVFAAVPHQVDNARKFGSVGGILNCAHTPGVIDEQFPSILQDLTANPGRLKSLADKWRGMMDGKGIERIVEILENTC